MTPLSTHPLRTTAQVDEYLTFCEGFRRLAGLDLTQYKRPQMERRIRTFVQRREHPDLSVYLGVLRRDDAELDAFLDRVTINVSELWRHPDQWQVLSRAVLPELARAGRVRCWSAGSSYGAEAFTLAAVARTAVPSARVEITGTDIDKRMIERARKAEFSAADARGVPAADLRRWFEPLPAGGYRAVDELRAMVRFETGDLLRVRPPAGTYDLVLCRNTAIYFSEEVRDDLHRRLAGALRPGGYLVVGGTERVIEPAAMGLKTAHPFTYRKDRD